MNRKVTVTPRWYGAVPTRHGVPLRKNQWARNGRKRKWVVRWYAPDGTRPQHTFGTKEEAEGYAATQTAEFEQHGPQARIRPKDVTLGQFVEELDRLRIGPDGTLIGRRTWMEYSAALTRFHNAVGADILLSDITKADAVRFVADLRSGEHNARGKKKGKLAIATINKAVITLKAAFNVAVKQLGYLQVNPFTGIKITKAAKTNKRYVTRDEFMAVMTTAERRHRDPLWWQAFIAVGYTAGTRLNEAVNLTWPDVDFENDTVHIIAKREAGDVQAWQPKDVDARTVPIPTMTVDLLTRMQALAEPGNPYVFISPERLAAIQAAKAAGTWQDTGHTLNNLRTRWLAIVQAAEIPHATIHDLRRSAITNWARRLPIHVVQELAGHADIRTTQQFYLSVTKEDLAAAREATADALQLDAK